MLVMLSAGMVTGLTATMIQATPVFAETEDCKDNNNQNCNEKNQKIILENDCDAKAKNRDGNSDSNGGSGDGGDNLGGAGGVGGSGGISGVEASVSCSNSLTTPVQDQN